MNKQDREKREYISVFCDERYAKKAWKEIIGESLESAADTLPAYYDPKTGEMTFASAVDKMAYDNVCARLKAAGKERKPMQAELIVESNILKARYNDTTFNTILDRTAGKVKDEVQVTQNPFEELSDEELALLAAHRASKKESE